MQEEIYRVGMIVLIVLCCLLLTMASTRTGGLLHLGPVPY